MYVLQIVLCQFVLFLLAIVLSVLLYTDSDCPFGIFKLFLWNICVTNDHGYVPLVIAISLSFPHSWLITGLVTKLRRRMPLLEQELVILQVHVKSPQIFSGVCVTRSLVLCVCYVDHCLYFFLWPLCCLFFFDIRILITPLVSCSSYLTFDISLIGNNSCILFCVKIFVN